MGIRIDRLAITSLAACAAYLFFLNTINSIPFAVVCAFIAMSLLRTISRRLPASPFSQKRRLLAEARAELEELSVTDPEQAARRIREIISQAYPGLPDTTAIIPVIRHPCGNKFSADDLIPLWRSAAGHPRVIIAVTAPCDESALILAPRLSHPTVSLTDAPGLIRMIARSGPRPALLLNPPPRSGLFAAISKAAGRAKAGKCILTGMVMLALFVSTGIPAYLIGGLLLMFIAGVSLRRRRIAAFD